MTALKRREKPLKEKRYLYYIYIYVHVRNSVDDIDDFDDFGNKTVNQNQEKTPNIPPKFNTFLSKGK